LSAEPIQARVRAIIHTGPARRASAANSCRKKEKGVEVIFDALSAFRVASLTPGTCRERLWLLPSGPDQIPTLQCEETRHAE